MDNPITEIATKTATNIITEVFKSALHGLKEAGVWFKAVTKEHDPFGIAARKYAERVRERYSSVRIFGMQEPMSLQDMYVQVSVLEKITAHHRATVQELETFFNRDRRSFGRVQNTKAGLELVNSPEVNKVLVLGKPGAGKTTFLKYLAIQALAGKITVSRIPVFVSIKDWSDSNLTLPAFILEQFDICGFPDAKPFIERILTQGKCLILLDGLDEATGPTDRVIRAICDFSDKYDSNQFIISCRIASYNYVFENFTEVEMADFGDLQIHAFIENWFGKDSKKATMCWQKLNDSENKPVKELACIPLLLTMLCLTFDELMDFPRNRSELYKEATDALLKKWDASRSISRDVVYKQLAVKNKEDLLSLVAAKTFEEGKYFIKQRELENHIASYIQNLHPAGAESIELDSEVVLKAIQAQHGLLIERANGIYSFSHLTLQEYFTARYVVKHEGMGATKRLIEIHFLDPQWREVFLLTVGMLAEADVFLLALRDMISKLVANTNISDFLREVESCIKNDAPYPLHVSKAVAIVQIDNGYWHGLSDQAHESALELAVALGLDESIGNRDADLDDWIDSDIAVGIALGTALDVDGQKVGEYLNGTKLFVDCLNADCYLTRGIRQKLLNGLLREPWEPE